VDADVRQGTTQVMSNNAGLESQILRVVVVSPGDVAAERRAVRGVLAELNREFGRERAFRLDGYYWETDAYAGFHPVGFQEGIVDPVLRLDSADIVIGIFWQRLGTKTDSGKTGTEHELDAALQAFIASEGKRPGHIAVYRSKQPIVPDDDEDPADEQQRADLKAYLRALKARFKDQAVIGNYDGPTAFADTLRTDLGNYLRRRFPVSPSKAVDLQPSAPPGTATFLAQYRARLAAFKQKWDLGSIGVPERSGGRPLNPELERMYLPLRFGEGWDPAKPELGASIGFEQLLALEHPLALRGAAGAGKTTWIRYTFRRCLAADSGLLPIAVELRKLAFNWRTRPGTGADQSFDKYLEEWADSYGCDGGALLAYIRDWRPGLPRPLLLIDGWDELGELGRDFRERLLGFKNEHPHLIVVVTSRPYGTEPPSSADGYAVFDVQPLNDAEIKLFAERFHAECYGDDQAAAVGQTLQFITALRASSDATLLARSPLQLTMMLLLHRTSPLPDRRHRLFDACLRSFLSARIDRAESEGVQPQADHWRPDDALERWRTAEQLAHGAQAGQSTSKAAGGDDRMEVMLGSEEDLLRYLPEKWDRSHKTGFIRWLSGPAAILRARADSTLQFAHLSYQEFLSASYMKSRLEGDERLRVVAERAKDPRWWESLRLWAGLTQDESPDKLAPILERLLHDSYGQDLVGLILADGNGDDKIMAAWAEQHSRAIACGWRTRTDRVLAAWEASGQAPRKELLTGQLEANVSTATWPAHLRLERWNLSGRPFTLPTNPRVRAFLSASKKAPESPEAAAVGRVWTYGTPIWPAGTHDTSLLQVWPTQRRLAGLRIQMAASLGAELSGTFLKWALVPRAQHQSVGHLVMDELASMSAPERHWMFGSVKSPWSLREALANFALTAHDDHGDSARILRTMMLSYSFFWAELFREQRLERWAKRVALRTAEIVRSQSTRAYVDQVERLSSVFWPRTALAVLNQHRPYFIFPAERREADLIALACEAYLGEGDSKPPALPEAIAEFESDPRHDKLWPALARHVARTSTAQDRDLLEKLARNPDLRAAPLSWGLRFIVRGDVWLNDGTFVTLDELSARVGLEPLPLLEESPVLPVLPKDLFDTEG